MGKVELQTGKLNRACQVSISPQDSSFFARFNSHPHFKEGSILARKIAAQSQQAKPAVPIAVFSSLMFN